MIQIILFLIIITFVAVLILDIVGEWDGAGILAGAVIGSPAILITLGFMFYFQNSMLEGDVIDQKIEIAQAQNGEIEAKARALIEGYMDHESALYKSLKTDSNVVLAATMYPELQSNQSVQKLIEIYEDNVSRIRDLENKKINLRVVRWWLYFGGAE